MGKPNREELRPQVSEQYVAGGKSRKLRRAWKRTSLFSHWRTQSVLKKAVDFEGKSIPHRAKDYLRIQILQWTWHYIKSRPGRRFAFPDYAASQSDNGIYNLAIAPTSLDRTEPVRVSLIGDWGSGTVEAKNVAERVEQDLPHFTVHLGDIYYVGTKKEIEENMLGLALRWPVGSHGSFALNANHEMYAQGKAYFTRLLPALGIRDGAGGNRNGQRASFFCLRNEHWLVIGLDTGYYSVGSPILEMIIKPNARLHPKLVEWLRKDVRLQDDHQRGVILLSHHQYYSQFERGYDRPAKQIAELLDRPVLWFWGHEHRFSVYGRHATKRGELEVYGRCIGHGGLPIEDIVNKPKRSRKYEVGLVLYDTRERTKITKADISVGYNGYANLVFKERELTIEYLDTERCLLREIWEVGEGGILKGKSIERLLEDEKLRIHEGARLEDALT